jgi:hypothetical protein
MKLAALALMTTLGLSPLASSSNADADPAPQRGQFRQLLLERFDRNHDGRLEPQERRHAIRALRKLARKLEMADHRGQGGQGGQDGEWRHARARALRRFDTNRDGVVGPEEMPPGMARKLRPLDRNHDGWLDERDRGARPDRGPRIDRGPRLDRGPRPDGPGPDQGPAPGDDGDRDPDRQ